MANLQTFNRIIEKALSLQGLEPEEALFLLDLKDKKLKEKVFHTAKEIKLKIYGRRIVFFAPLYVTNQCVNNCLYCGFRAGNEKLKRKILNIDEIKREARLLTQQGHKRLLLVAGEDLEAFSVEELVQAIDEIYQSCDIRRININVAPLSVGDYRIVKKAGIGTYQLFQETYHRETYAAMHPSGPKKDFDWRLQALDRAMEAGIDDAGIGVLFGLFDPRFEVKSLLEHCQRLEKDWGVGPHTISVPRLKPAQGSLLTKVPFEIDDDFFKLIVAVLRLAVPYTGIILSTRETAQLRDEILLLGVSQISAGSHTSPGGYEKEEVEGQFIVSDQRSLDEVLASVIKSGHMPSFCTACYRKSRTGKAFMELAKSGTIKGKCLPNALLTFSEYLRDYAPAELQKLGNDLVAEELKSLSKKERREITEKLAEINMGSRDLPV